MGGLLVATLLTLFFLPALYAFCYGVPLWEEEPVAGAEPEKHELLAMAAE